MRDAMQYTDPMRDDWKRRVVEFAGSEMFDRLFKEGMSPLRKPQPTSMVPAARTPASLTVNSRWFTPPRAWK